MSNLREAAQQALEALEEYQSKGAPFWACDSAVAALRAALEQQEQMISEGWRQCAQGQRVTQFCAVAEQARQEEREACAKVCDAEVISLGNGSREGLIAGICAAAIRARGEHEPQRSRPAGAGGIGDAVYSLVGKAIRRNA